MSRSREHFNYERYVLFAVRDIEEELENAALNQNTEDKRQKDLKRQAMSTSAPILGNVTSTLYAELVAEEDKPVDKRKHAIVGFWRKDEITNTHICYRMIRIDKPLTMSPENEGCLVETFLHVSDKDEIFYFTKIVDESDGIWQERIVMSTLDNKACVLGKGLQPITTNIDYPPVTQTIIISDKDSSYLLKSIFNRPS